MESPGFARAAVSMRGSFPGQEGELEAETLLAPPLLQVSDVIQGEGDWRGSDRGGASGFLPSFFQQPFNGLLPYQTWQLFRERDRASDHLEGSLWSFLPLPVSDKGI